MRMPWISSLISLLLAAPAFAMPFKCDKQQMLCEVQTKRLTVGDKVGVFSSDGQLAAIGEVVEIRNKSRMIKITQKWASLFRSYEMEVIEDEKAKNPEKYFRIITPLPELSWGVGLGGVNLGIGDSFVGTSLDGGVYWLLWRDMFLTGRLHYITGEGKASDNLGAGVAAASVSVTSAGLSVGISELIAPYEMVALRMDGEIGLSNATVTLPAGLDEGDVLNNRIDDGVGLYLRFGVAAIWRRDGLQPEVGFSFLRLHAANSPGLFVGVSAPID
ncbi:MAG TPA: hypothetical protein VE954_05675 [Oligoflexus sp.]|uniref:hypothetical protein n=1 Tax=Oligoflexus sp. TaxID=1971216 RepID=UPI002D285387|nr:hypothetical protein [Oligoflexus sp.]HYX32581.1 hypothetical protein [Oligoflexus sp.]